jgi:integrase
MLDAGQAMRIAKIPNVEILGQRLGNWLEKDQLRNLLTGPLAGSPNRALRDRTALWIMATSGLRRAETAALCLSHLQLRDGRPVFVDLVGKRRKIRSVPVHAQAYDMIQVWIAHAGITDGYLLRAVDNGDHILSKPVCVETLRELCERHGDAKELTFRPHDLRRTFATLAKRGGADYEALRQALGHATVTTTERYLRRVLILDNAAADHISF